MVHGLVDYEDCTHVVPEFTLRERIIRAMYDSLQVTGLLSREVFRLHEVLEYIDSDPDNRLPSAVWQEPNKLVGTELIPSTLSPPNDGIPGAWLILTSIA